jgi:hypothetical protein
MATDVLHEHVVAAELEAGVVSKLNLLPASRLTQAKNRIYLLA